MAKPRVRPADVLFHDKPVEVRLMKRMPCPKGVNPYYFEVFVRSSVRRFHKMKGIWEHERRDQTQEIGILAGHLAEEMAERYGESKLDPSDCARAAMQAYVEIMREHPHVNAGVELPRYADHVIGTDADVA